MKVSLNLAQQFSNVDLKKIPHDLLLQRVGAQLGAVEEVIDWAPKYKGVVVVKVITCDQHPNADRLHVCMVDDGGKVKGVKRDNKGLVQVVCGAPNVKSGMLVAWIPPGATVPATYGTQDPFVLEARELRGVVSNGMLASAKELGISDEHDGILEILPEEVNKTPKPGEPLTEYFGLDDFIIDCENKMFTHRPDCFGNLGVARELAGISGLNFKSPDWYLKEPRFESKNDIKLTVKNETGRLVPRFMAVAMKNVQVKPSPVWMQAALSRVGIKPINNVVDVTNYVMHLTGQPLHAFDYDKLGSNQLGPRMAKKGEKMALLNGKTIELTEEDIVIAAGSRAVGLAGIMGGSETEVDENTKSIIIECATFDMYTIRRSSMRHGLFTDASTRYTKGQSPLQNARVLAYAMKNMLETTGAVQASSVQDIRGKLNDPADVVVTAQFINERLGSSLSIKEIGALLEKVEFGIISVPANKNRLHVRPPFWRTDIEQPEDIVEEIGRLYGFDKLPVLLPTRSSKATEKNPSFELKSRLRKALKAAGANEVLTYSFVHGDLMRKVHQDKEKAFHVRNALSPDLQYYRLSLTPSLLDKVQTNIRSDMIGSDDNEFAIYEIGTAHNKLYSNPNHYAHEKDVPEEMTNISTIFAADDKTAERKYKGSAFYQAAAYLDLLLSETGKKNTVHLEPLSKDKLYNNEWLIELAAPFEPGRSAFIMDAGGLVWGVVGEYRASVRKALKLPAFSAGFETDITLFSGGFSKYVPLSVYPKTQQDITLEVKQSTSYADIAGALQDELMAAENEHGYQATLVPRDIFQPENLDIKRLTFRIWLTHPARTLTTEETNHLLDKLAATANDKFQSKRI